MIDADRSDEVERTKHVASQSLAICFGLVLHCVPLHVGASIEGYWKRVAFCGGGSGGRKLIIRHG